MSLFRSCLKRLSLQVTMYVVPTWTWRLKEFGNLQHSFQRIRVVDQLGVQTCNKRRISQQTRYHICPKLKCFHDHQYQDISETILLDIEKEGNICGSTSERTEIHWVHNAITLTMAHAWNVDKGPAPRQILDIAYTSHLTCLSWTLVMLVKDMYSGNYLSVALKQYCIHGSATPPREVLFLYV